MSPSASVSDSSSRSSSSSGESSPKQQRDDLPWAKPEEFEAKKGIITHLYDLSGRNLTLKETMRIMEEKHGFYGTAKMYKSRISKWKLRKNLKPIEVIELVRQYKEREAAGKSTHVYFRGEKMDQRRVREYLRLVHGMTAGPATEKRIKIEGITCRTPSPPPTAVAHHHLPIPIPRTPTRVRTPDIVREPQQRPQALRRMVTVGFETGFWRRMTGSYVEPCAAIKLWYRKTLLVNRALQYGRMQLGFRLMQQCFDDFTALMRNHHPYLWIYTHRVAMELAEQSPEAAQSFARLACNLSQALNHPADATFDHMLHPHLESTRSTETNIMSARDTCDFYRHLLREQVGLDRSELNSEPSFTTARIAHYSLAEDVELGYEAMRKTAKMRPEVTSHPSPPQVEIMRRKEYQAWCAYYSGYYEEAQRIMGEISSPELIQNIDQYPDALFSYYDTAALLARNRPGQEEADEEEAVGTCRRLIDFCTHEYGLASLQTVDALAELETYLRRRVPHQPTTQWSQAVRADAVLQEVHAALDLLDCQTDPDLGNQQTPSFSYVPQDPLSLGVEWMDIPIDPALADMG
ncbi:hypothetical protein PG989_013665 [Apiospora arundinis]